MKNHLHYSTEIIEIDLDEGIDYESYNKDTTEIILTNDQMQNIIDMIVKEIVYE